MTKNFVKTEFKSLWRGVLIGLCMTGLFLFSGNVFGATIFVDDFNSYNDGGLGGQGNWVWPFFNDFEVQGDITFEGLKAISCGANLQCSAEKIGDETPTGATSFSVKLARNETGRIENLGFWFKDDDVNLYKIEIAVRDDSYEIWIYGGDGIRNWKEFSWTDIWLTFDVEWNFNTQKWRVRYDGIWSVWENSYENRTWLELDEIQISSTQGDSKRYIDNIVGLPFCEWGEWDLCLDYDDCVGAGGQWFFSMLIGQDYCGEPVSIPELCGNYWDCQYCETEITCLEVGIDWCEWVNRGGGENCYMVETMPPEQEWEIPDLEDCSELTGVEFLLCDIKNDVLGVFMPSQEKINDLYLTIGAFENRFPFNYVQSLKMFFTDISESLDEEKSIPIKILGQESEVSFDFWEKETEIGGISETLKNVVFDFTTFIILMGFFVWFISLIKRFF